MFTKAPDARAQFADFDRLVAQELSDKGVWRDVDSFYAEAALGSMKPADYDKVSSSQIDGFEAGVLALLREVLPRAQKDRQVKAIYCEYAMDVDHQYSLAAHLCTAFSADEDHWVTGNSSRKDTLEFSAAIALFQGVVVARKETLASSVCQAFINARLLTAWGRAVQTLSPELPIAFGRHQAPVVRLMSRMSAKK